MHFYVSLFENSQTVEAKPNDAVVVFSSEANPLCLCAKLSCTFQSAVPVRQMSMD